MGMLPGAYDKMEQFTVLSPRTRQRTAVTTEDPEDEEGTEAGVHAVHLVLGAFPFCDLTIAHRPGCVTVHGCSNGRP